MPILYRSGKHGLPGPRRAVEEDACDDNNGSKHINDGSVHENHCDGNLCDGNHCDGNHCAADKSTNIYEYTTYIFKAVLELSRQSYQ